MTTQGKSRGKRKGRRRSGFRLALYAFHSVLLLVMVAGAAYLFTLFLQKPDYFHVKRIGVLGARVLAEADIVAQSGISKADNILLLNVHAIETRLKTLPYVKTCTVTRLFPDKVIIHVEEREAVATLLMAGRSFAIDAETMVLRELSLDEQPTGPYISNVPGLSEVETGRPLTQKPVQEALRVWSEFRASEMANDVTVSELAAYNSNDIRMYCDELPYEIRWGRNNYESQARRLDLLWEAKDKQLNCLEYVDTRFDPNLYLR